jgi:DNA polymerase elongation subunit (family B)
VKKGYEDALLLVTQAIDKIMTGEGLAAEDLVISKLLRQDISKYKSLFPHVSAAIQLSNDTGKHPMKGDTIQYVYTNSQHNNPLCRVTPIAIGNTKNNPQWTEEKFMDFVSFQLGRVSRGEITESTIKNYYKSTKLFCEMNGCAQLINWKMITRGLPKGRQAANDRAPSIEELQKLVEYPDRRIKPIVCV